MSITWRRKRKPDNAPERLQATVMIHLGIAWRAHNDGEPLKAIRHLGLAAEAIMSLIERWSGGAGEQISEVVEVIEVIEDEREHQVQGPDQRHVHLSG